MFAQAGLYPGWRLSGWWPPRPASAQESGGDVQVKLSLAGDQTSFRIGDPIRLIIEFTADRDGTM